VSREGRERLARAVRTLIEHAVEADLTNDDANRAAGAIEAVARDLDRLERRLPKEPRLPDLDDLQAHFGGDPVLGRSNPIAPPVEIEIVGSTVRGRANLTRPYEGPPGHVHGAVIASVFDIMLGLANIVTGNPSMTGTLSVRYLRPTPLFTDLVFEAKTDRTEGRKVFVTGSLDAGGARSAEAEGIFVQMRPEEARARFLKE
jgi:acyl-coenzyme A thioesterase PaaI-like protein